MISRIFKTLALVALLVAFGRLAAPAQAAPASATIDATLSVKQQGQDYILTATYKQGGLGVVGVTVVSQWNVPGGTLWCQVTTDEAGNAYCTKNLAYLAQGTNVTVDASFQAAGGVIAYRNINFTTGATQQPTPIPSNPGDNTQGNAGDPPYIDVAIKNNAYLLTGRFIYPNNDRKAGVVMSAEWRIGSKSMYCEAVTDQDGKAYCAKNLSRYSKGTKVNVDVSFRWTENGGQRVVYRSLQFNIGNIVGADNRVSAIVGSLTSPISERQAAPADQAAATILPKTGAGETQQPLWPTLLVLALILLAAGVTLKKNIFKLD